MELRNATVDQMIDELDVRGLTGVLVTVDRKEIDYDRLSSAEARGEPCRLDSMSIRQVGEKPLSDARLFGTLRKIAHAAIGDVGDDSFFLVDGDQ